MSNIKHHIAGWRALRVLLVAMVALSTVAGGLAVTASTVSAASVFNCDVVVNADGSVTVSWEEVGQSSNFVVPSGEDRIWVGGRSYRDKEPNAMYTIGAWLDGTKQEASCTTPEIPEPAAFDCDVVANADGSVTVSWNEIGQSSNYVIPTGEDRIWVGGRTYNDGAPNAEYTIGAWVNGAKREATCTSPIDPPTPPTPVDFDCDVVANADGSVTVSWNEIGQSSNYVVPFGEVRVWVGGRSYPDGAPNAEYTIGAWVNGAKRETTCTTPALAQTIAVDDVVDVLEGDAISIEVTANDELSANLDRVDVVSDSCGFNADITTSSEGVLTGTAVAAGTCRVTYRLYSTSGSTDTADVTINVTANRQTVAGDDVIDAVEGDAISIDVTANDEVSAHVARVELLTDSCDGIAEVTLSIPGVLSGNAVAPGTCTLTYRLYSTSGSTDTATVTINVTEDRRTVAVDDVVDLVEGDAASVDAIDNDQLSENLDRVELESHDCDGIADVALSEQGLLSDSAVTPGTCTVTYRVISTSGSTDRATVTINVTPAPIPNRAPDCNRLQILSYPSGTRVNGSWSNVVLGKAMVFFSDPDGDELTVKATGAGLVTKTYPDYAELTISPYAALPLNGQNVVGVGARVSDGEFTDYCATVNVPVYGNVTPVAVDLSGDGRIGVTGATTSRTAPRQWIGASVLFDIDADGTADRMEWFDGSGDGILVDNRDGKARDGIDGSRLFGDTGGFADGYAKLRLLDIDHSGAVDGAELDGLLVWIDNGDAQPSEAELATTAEVHLTSISVLVNDDGGFLRSTAIVADAEVMTEDVYFANLS